MSDYVRLKLSTGEKKYLGGESKTRKNCALGLMSPAGYNCTKCVQANTAKAEKISFQEDAELRSSKNSKQN